tara:strand:+ start:241 stop:882 length:642 start_codon:yes stop_codon:yes gene_type:complete
MIQTSLFPLPKEDKPIQALKMEDYKPRKVEEIVPYAADVLPDTYMIYPTGGYHPFFGVPNTFPIYQLPIWPYIKRINYPADPRAKSGYTRDRQNKGWREGWRQANAIFADDNYPIISLKKIGFRKSFNSNDQKTREVPKDSLLKFHRLIAFAWIPNPHKKTQVCHINDDKSNFLIKNLKWGTRSENMREKIAKRPDTVEQKYLNMVIKGIIKG